MSDVPSPDPTVLDARDVDGEPFSEIMAALEALDEDDALVLVNGFEPVPLYDVLDARGFTHDTEQAAENEWRIRIEHAN